MPPINLTATESGGFFLEEERAGLTGPASGIEQISYRDKAYGPSLDNKVRLGDHATVIVIPPQPYLISGPTLVNSTQIIRSFAGPFTQASNLLRSAILAIVSDTTDDVATPLSHLSAFVTTDGGLTWSEVVGPYIFQWDYTMWQATYGSGWTPSDTQVHLAGFCQPPWPAGNNLGTLPPGYDVLLGCGLAPMTSGRDGSSDDIFTLNAPLGALISPQQMPYGLQATGLSWPFNQLGFPDDFFSYGYVSQYCAASLDLWLYCFNLTSFAWTARGKCGECMIFGPGGSYAHGGGTGGGFYCAPNIIGIRNGRGIAMTHFGGQYFTGVGNGYRGSPLIPGSVYPVNAGPGSGAEMVINFDAVGGDHHWSYVTDPDSNTSNTNTPNNPWRAGLRSNFTTRGVMSNGDIVCGGSQTNLAGDSSRYRIMRWPLGSTSEIPIFENIVGPTPFAGILYPPDGIPPVTPLNGTNLLTFDGLADSYRQDRTGGRILTTQPVTSDGDYFGQMWNPPTVVVNRSAQAWVAMFGVLGNRPQTPTYTERLRVRLSWVDFPNFLNPYLRPEPLLYQDAIPPPSGHESSGSKIHHQFQAGFYASMPIGHVLGPDQTVGVATVQPVLNPYTTDFCQFNPPGGAQYEGGIYNIYYSRAWIPWPSLGGAYIAGRGNWILG